SGRRAQGDRMQGRPRQRDRPAAAVLHRAGLTATPATRRRLAGWSGPYPGTCPGGHGRTTIVATSANAQTVAGLRAGEALERERVAVRPEVRREHRLPRAAIGAVDQHPVAQHPAPVAREPVGERRLAHVAVPLRVTLAMMPRDLGRPAMRADVRDVV